MEWCSVWGSLLWHKLKPECNLYLWTWSIFTNMGVHWLILCVHINWIKHNQKLKSNSHEFISCEILFGYLPKDDGCEIKFLFFKEAHEWTINSIMIGVLDIFF